MGCRHWHRAIDVGVDPSLLAAGGQESWDKDPCRQSAYGEISCETGDWAQGQLDSCCYQAGIESVIRRMGVDDKTGKTSTTVRSRGALVDRT